MIDPAFREARIALAAVLLSGGPPIGAEDRVRTQVSVTSVDLDVSITRKSEPVTDIRPDELKLEIDGKPVPIDYWTKVDTRVSAPPTAANGSRSFLLVIDEDHLPPGERARALDAAVDFIGRLAPSDALSVAVVDKVAFRVLTPFEAGREGGLQAVRTLAAARKLVFDEGSARKRALATFQELERASRAFGARAGRKEMVLLSSGIPRPGFSGGGSSWIGLTAATKGAPVLVERMPRVPSKRDNDPFEQMLRQANRSRVTIHTIGAVGLQEAPGGGDSGFC